jgi:hypothetical protein
LYKLYWKLVEVDGSPGDLDVIFIVTLLSVVEGIGSFVFRRRSADLVSL